MLAAQYVDIMTPRLLLLLRLRLPGLDPAPTSHLTGTAGIREIREEALEVRRHQSQGWVVLVLILVVLSQFRSHI